jgi:hypothetical protein
LKPAAQVLPLGRRKFLICSDIRFMLGASIGRENMADWLAAADAYLYSISGVGIEETLCDACISGRVRPELAGNLQIESELLQRTSEDDGAGSEFYCGKLTLAGLRYNFECRLFIDSDGTYFVSDIARFEPMEWQTGIRVA